MFEEIKGLGLNCVEIGSRYNRSQVEEMPAILKDLDMRVTSVHNFCPLPDDYPSPRHPTNYYRMSSLDEEERKSAVKWTKNSIDTASMLGAQALVIHAGTIVFEDEMPLKLMQMYREGQVDTNEYQQLKEQFIEARQQKQPPYLDSVIKSLREFMPYALDKNIKVGLESRIYPDEIPNHQEIKVLLELFYDQGLRYWHDVGHCEVSSRLGITPHKNFLNDYKDQLLGFHVHGVKILKDHHCPFEGDFDLNKVLPYMNKEHLVVIESQSHVSPEKIRAAIKKLPQ